MPARLYSVIISGYKNTSRQTLEGVLACRRNDEVDFEVILLDNTADGRHREMATEVFSTAAAGIRTSYLHHPIPGKAEAGLQGVRGKTAGRISV